MVSTFELNSCLQHEMQRTQAFNTQHIYSMYTLTKEPSYARNAKGIMDVSHAKPRHPIFIRLFLLLALSFAISTTWQLVKNEFYCNFLGCHLRDCCWLTWTNRACSKNLKAAGSGSSTPSVAVAATTRRGTKKTQAASETCEQKLDGK